MSKIESINRKNYKVFQDEYIQVPHLRYNNLKILAYLGEQERIVGLLSDLASALSGGDNYDAQLPDLLMIGGASHGGFIPINCASAFNKVIVYDIANRHDAHIVENIQQQNVDNIIVHSTTNGANIVNVVAECREKPCIVFIESGCDATIQQNVVDAINAANAPQAGLPIILGPASLQNRLNVDNARIYKVLPHEHYLIPDNLKELCLFVPNDHAVSFNREFRYFIKEGIDAIDYDNMVHLTMIVKNAGDGFEDILRRNLDIIDRWTILDTGSTDNTMDIIKRVLANKKGNLYQEPFIDFRASRNRCLALAPNDCKYKIILDDTYVVEGNARKFLAITRGDQFADSFSFYIKSDDTEYASNRLIKSDRGLKYIYKIHEVIQFENNINVCIPLNDAWILDVRSDFMEKRTMDRKALDLKLLDDMVEEEPDNPRHLYYIAQTYNLLNKIGRAHV